MYSIQRNAVNMRGRDDATMPPLDLTYVTERIIAMLFPFEGNETAYLSSNYDMVQKLRNKHGDNYMIVNISERRSDMHQFHKQVLDFGWPDALSPPLERLCNICKTIDSWLNSFPKNVVVLHCKGGLGRMAVIVAAYIDYSNICAGSDQDFDQRTMKRFYDEKLAILIQPSQRRYVHYFAGLLSGAIKINNSPLFLHKIIIRGIPNFDGQGACHPFIKIYQGMQPIYVSNVFTPAVGVSFICITLDPCLQLRSDVLVKCFNKSGGNPSAAAAGRDVIFRCQFHTCTVSNNLLKFGKSDLDEASDDDRFPDHGGVEFVFTSAPDRISKPYLAAEIGSSLDRWNSYENFATDAEEKTGFVTQSQKISTTSSAQYNPKYRLDPEVIPNGSSTAVNSSFHSSTVNRARSTVQEYGTTHSHTSLPVPSKTGNEQEQLDEILRELLGDHAVPRDNTSLAPASYPRDALVPTNAPLLQGTITTESDNMRTTLSWQASQAGPAKSALVTRQTVAQPTPHAKIESNSMRYRESTSQRQPPDVDLDRWGATERYLYDAPSYKETRQFDTRSETMTREEIINAASAQQRFLAPCEHVMPARTPSPSAGFRGEPPSHQLRSASPSFAVPRGGQVPPPQRETLRRTVSDHRRYASDSEDHMSWLEEQRSRLPSRNSGRRTWRQQLASENAELKSAQSAYYRSRRTAQSDTEDGGATYRRYGPSSSLDEPDTLNRSYTFEHDPRPHESNAYNSYQYNYETKSSRYPPSQFGQGYRPPAYRVSAPTSPVIPERGDSSRDAVLRSQTNAREWLRSSEAHSTRYDDAHSPRAYESDVEVQRLAPPGGGHRAPTPHDRTTSPFARNTPIPKLGEVEEEVISLQPIGRGIQSLEPGTAVETIGGTSISAYPGSANQFTNHSVEVVHQRAVPGSGGYGTLNQASAGYSSAGYNTLNHPQYGGAQTFPSGAASVQQNGSQTFVRQQQNFQATSTQQRGIVQSGGHLDQFATLQQQPVQQQSFFVEGRETGATGHHPPPSAGTQRNFAHESSYTHHLQRGQSLPMVGQRGPPFQQPVALHGAEQGALHSGGYSYETTQQRQFVQRNQQSSDFIGGGHVESGMQRSPSLGYSVQVGRAQQDSLRRLNSSMQNLLNAENAGANETSTGNFYAGRTRAASVSSIGGGGGGAGQNPAFLFVCDTSKFWHKENMTRDEATAYLLDKPPGWFIVRNSSTFPGAFGLAVKVAQIPPNVTIRRDPQSELVRHFLIEPTQLGVQLKGNPIEPVFASLSALIYQHTLTPLALPLKLVLPLSNESARFDTMELHTSDSITHLAGPYAAFNVLYVNSVDVETMTGPEAMFRAIDGTFGPSAGPPDAVEVNLKVSSVGITLTDNRRKLFFRRHYPINSLTYCGFDAKDRKWNFTGENGFTVSIARVFGFVARKQGSAVENCCHLFAELDSTHPSIEVIRAITGAMSGQGVSPAR